MQEATTAEDIQPDGDAEDGNIDEVDAELQALAEVTSLQSDQEYCTLVTGQCQSLNCCSSSH